MTEVSRTVRRLGILLAILAAASVATLAYKLWPLLHPTALQVAEPDASCDLRQGSCRLGFPGGGTVSLDIQPRGIPTAAPLTLVVGTEGLDVDRVEVDFAGVDMYMGFNRVSLSQVSPGRYRGQGMIPVCVRARMTWEARVLVHTPRGLLAAPFRFDTVR